MKQKDRVRIVREAGYKGYDKSLDSKCANPQKSGVRRLDEVQAAIEAVATAADGVLAKAQEAKQAAGDALCDEESYAVVMRLGDFPRTVREAQMRNEPSIITRYLVDLAQEYNKFYYQNRILTDDVQTTNARLVLTQSVRNILCTGLGLLGIAAPEKM